jgi:hypothetical protein
MVPALEPWSHGAMEHVKAVKCQVTIVTCKPAHACTHKALTPEHSLEAKKEKHLCNLVKDSLNGIGLFGHIKPGLSTDELVSHNLGPPFCDHFVQIHRFIFIGGLCCGVEHRSSNFGGCLNSRFRVWGLGFACPRPAY